MNPENFVNESTLRSTTFGIRVGHPMVFSIVSRYMTLYDNIRNVRKNFKQDKDGGRPLEEVVHACMNVMDAEQRRFDWAMETLKRRFASLNDRYVRNHYGELVRKDTFDPNSYYYKPYERLYEYDDAGYCIGYLFYDGKSKIWTLVPFEHCKESDKEFEKGYTVQDLAEERLSLDIADWWAKHEMSVEVQSLQYDNVYTGLDLQIQVNMDDFTDWRVSPQANSPVLEDMAPDAEYAFGATESPEDASYYTKFIRALEASDILANDAANKRKFCALLERIALLFINLRQCTTSMHFNTTLLAEIQNLFPSGLAITLYGIIKLVLFGGKGNMAENAFFDEITTNTMVGTCIPPFHHPGSRMDKMVQEAAAIAAADKADEEAVIPPPADLDYEEQSAADIVALLKRLMQIWNDVRHSVFVQKIKKVIALLVTAGVCHAASLEFTTGMFGDFWKNSGVDGVSGVDFFTHIMDVFVFFLEKALHFFGGGSWLSVFYHDDKAMQYEKEFTFIMTKLPFLETGQLAKVDMDPTEFQNRVDKLYESTLMMIRRTRAAPREVLNQKLLRIQKVKDEIIMCMKNAPIREAPFAICLHGPSAIGKTNVVGILANHMLRVNGLDASMENYVTLNTSDKYQSEYRPGKSVVILDDIANIKAAHAQGNHCQLIIDFMNNDPKCALMASVDMKGKVYLSPKLVIGTSNKLDLDADVYSNEPLSIARRFPYYIKPIVKPAYCKPGTRMLDPEKMINAVEDAWVFEISEPVAAPRGPTLATGVAYVVITHKNVLMNNVCLHDLLQFLGEKSQAHFVQQKRLVASRYNLHEAQLCAHSSYSSICPECRLEPQAMPDFVGLYYRLNKLNPLWFLVCTYVPRFTTNTIMSWIMRRIMTSVILEDAYQTSMAVAWAWTIVAATMLFFLNFTVLGWTWYFMVLALVFATSFILEMKAQIHELSRQCGFMPLTNLQQHLKSKIKWARPMAAVMAIGSAVYGIRSLYHLYKRATYSEQGAETSIPLPDDNPKANAWKKVILTPPEVKVELRTATYEQVLQTISKKIAHADFKYNSGGGTKCDIVPLKSNLWLAPWHVLSKGVCGVHVTLVTPGTIGPNFYSKIGEKCVQRIGNMDLGLVYLPSGGSQRDISVLLPLTTATKNTAGHLVYRQDNGELLECEFNCEPGVYGSNGDVTEVVRYKLPMPSFVGLCMATILSKGINPHILGFHIAGVTGETPGIGVQLTLGDFQRAEALLYEKSAVVFQSHSYNGMNLNSEEPKIEVLPKLHPKSSFNFLEDGTVNHYGTHTGARRRFSSAVVPTLISQSVTEVTGVECTFGPPKNMGNYVPWKLYVSNATHTNELDPDILEMATQDFHSRVQGFLDANEHLKTRIHPLANVAILSGADGVWGVDSINWNSSGGWPKNRPKRESRVEVVDFVPGISCPTDVPAEVWESVFEKEQVLGNGERIFEVHRANLKDEPTKLEKEKVRVFAGCTFELLILVRKYFLMIAKMMMENPEIFECAVGSDAHGPDWTRLTKQMLKFGAKNVVAGDYKDYDTRISSQLTFAAMNVFIHIAEWAGYTPFQLRIMRGLATEICQPCYELNGEMLVFNGTNPSGHPLTVFVNNIVNSFYQRYAYYDVHEGDPPGPYHEHVSLLCYGDDNKMSVKEDAHAYNHTSIAASLGRCGIVYTMADKAAESVPFIDNENCTFLKRGSIWSEKYRQYLAPLEEESIFKSLHCVVKSAVLTPEEHAAECITNGMMEYFYHGEEKYNLRYSQFNQILTTHSLYPYLKGNMLPTFAEAEAAYMLKCGVSAPAS